jgi:hypothetical protein
VAFSLESHPFLGLLTLIAMLMPKDIAKISCSSKTGFIKERTKLGYQNYCKAGMMAKCTAGNAWKDHRLCKFSRKSSVSDRCMYYRNNMDGHCDCVFAQRETMCRL